METPFDTLDNHWRTFRRAMLSLVRFPLINLAHFTCTAHRYRKSTAKLALHYAKNLTWPLAFAPENHELSVNGCWAWGSFCYLLPEGIRHARRDYRVALQL